MRKITRMKINKKNHKGEGRNNKHNTPKFFWCYKAASTNISTQQAVQSLNQAIN